jgi:hypothetical protein
MFGTPSVPEAIKAETDYRHERTRYEVQSSRRREHAERAGRPRLLHALRGIRRTAAA